MQTNGTAVINKLLAVNFQHLCLSRMHFTAAEKINKCNIRVSADSLDGSNMPHSFTYQTVHEDSVVSRERARLCPICHVQVN